MTGNVNSFFFEEGKKRNDFDKYYHLKWFKSIILVNFQIARQTNEVAY